MKKDLAIIGGLFLLIVFLIIFGQGFTSTSFFGEGTKSGSFTNSEKNTTKVQIKDLVLDAEIADTAKNRKKGLSKRDSLELNRGMLFVFDDAGTWSIWMKDMEFAIDILWIDDNKKVVAVAGSVAPEINTDDDDLKIYKPSNAAKYILEINAGLADRYEINEGDEVNFNF